MRQTWIWKWFNGVIFTSGRTLETTGVPSSDYWLGKPQPLLLWPQFCLCLNSEQLLGNGGDVNLKISNFSLFTTSLFLSIAFPNEVLKKQRLEGRRPWQKLPPVKAGRQRQTYFYVKLDDKCSYLRSAPGSCKVGVRLLASLSSGHDGNIYCRPTKVNQRRGVVAQWIFTEIFYILMFNWKRFSDYKGRYF